MSLEDDVAFLQQIPTLSVLGRQALRVLAIGAELRRLPSGAVLFYAGELADGAYVVRDGTLLVEPGGGTAGRDWTVGRGAMVGELALITETLSPVTAIAREPATVIRISRNLFRKTLEGYPAAALRLRDMMAKRAEAWANDLAAVRRQLAAST